MNYYEVNKECIKLYDPLLYKRLYEEVKEIQSTVENIDQMVARDGTSILKIVSEGKEYRLNSIYRPEEEARRWREQYHFYNPQTVMVMFGLGNGIFAHAILEELQEDGLLLIYEPSLDIFNYVLQHYDLTALLQRDNVYIYVPGMNEEEFSIHLKSELHIANYKNLIDCYHPQYNLMFSKNYEEYKRIIESVIKFVRVNINTGAHFGKKQIENILANFKFLKESISLCDLKEHIPNHVPAIVVAAGPSVEKNIQYLKELKGRAVIFAVDRVLDTLLDFGIEPDFVVSIDAKKSIEYFSKRTDVTVPLICYGESNYEILNHHAGKKIMGTVSSFTEEIYRCAGKPIPYLIPSGSVAIVAFHVCVVLGFTKVILVGQDLAYDGDISHSGSVKEKNPFQKDVMVKGINGEMIKSRGDWERFIEMYKDSIQRNPHVEVIDAKLHGAKIPGTVNMELKDAVEKYCTNTIELNREDIERIVGFNEIEWKTVHNYMLQIPSELLIIKEKASRGIKLCGELLTLYNKRKLDYNKIDTYVNKLRNINQELGGSSLYSLLDKHISAIVTEELEELYQFSDNENENEVRVIEKSQCIYQATIKTVEYVEPLLEEAMKNVN